MNDPKLELYKIKLYTKETGNRTNFRELFRKKFNLGSESVPLNDFFNSYFKALMIELNGEGYYLNKQKQKGYTIAYRSQNGNGNRVSYINQKPAEWTI